MFTEKTNGHLNALISIFIWGTTFVSTKLLLNSFTPLEILFYRFILGFSVLWLIYPRRLKLTERKQEWLFVGAGLCGITLYFLLENIALTFSTASNIGVIVSIVPFFTALLSWYIEGEKITKKFVLGFFVAIIGIGLISFNGSHHLQLNPVGDLLAVLAAVVWAFYSMLTKKIATYGYPTVAVTRHTFLYGLIFMLPALIFLDFNWKGSLLIEPINFYNLLFLGLGASALCFVSWNKAVRSLGPVKTSVYIYMVPVITVITSIIVLEEKITVMSSMGILLTFLGLFISESKWSIRKGGIKEGEGESINKTYSTYIRKMD